MKKFKMPDLLCFKAISIMVLACLFSMSNLQAQTPGGQAVVSTVTKTAKVTKINQKSREVTIKTEDGSEYSFVAGDEVKNLSKVKKGDVITAVYTESIAYQVRSHDNSMSVTKTDAIATAQPGEKPAGAVGQQTTATVTITAIDPNLPSVTFKGPKGNTKTVKVNDPEKLKGVKVGDMVDIVYTEAVAVSVDKPQKK
jgi:Cu/Ag efflux protein CusF